VIFSPDGKLSADAILELKRQNPKPNPRIFLSPPHMGGDELRFVHDAFESNYIAPLGPMVDAFEKEFAEKVGIAHVVALSSGTAAMHLPLRILGVGSAPVKWSSPRLNKKKNIQRGKNLTGQGDEVVTSTLTFVGSVSPIVFQGATPVFIDSDRVSWNINPDLLVEGRKAVGSAADCPGRWC